MKEGGAEEVGGGLILKGKQAKIIIALKDKNQEWHIADLAKVANVTYVHTSNFIKACEQQGIVSYEKHGKIKVVKLTEKGDAVANEIANVVNILAQKSADVPSQ
ncbi:MAG: winged helix DNA-binding protein [Candidatus Micrarchaeia archaeon]